MSSTPPPRLLVHHIGGVFRCPAFYITRWMRAKFGESRPMHSLRRVRATRDTDVVSILVASAEEAVFDAVERAACVMVWNPEQSGSPRFRAICDAVERAMARTEHAAVWTMVTVAEAVFMWDVPAKPPVLSPSLPLVPLVPFKPPSTAGPTKEGTPATFPIRCFFLNHGRRRRFTDVLQRAFPPGRFKVVEGIAARDAELSGADVVVNIHARTGAGAIELHRISRCLAMGCVVLSEGTTDVVTRRLLAPFEGDPNTGVTFGELGHPSLMFARPGATVVEFMEWVVRRVTHLGSHLDVGLAARQRRQRAFYTWFNSLENKVIFKDEMYS